MQVASKLREIGSGEGKLSVFDRIRASVCHYCPVCRHARKNPESAIGKIVREHHAEQCEMWKAEREVYGEGKLTNSQMVKAHMLWKGF